MRYRLAAIRVALLAVCLWALAATPADFDLWGHLRFGADIVAARAIPGTDPYSFTSDRAWVNHEWLSEVLMFGAYRAAGPAGLVLLKLAAVIALVSLALWMLRRLPHAIARDRFAALLILGILPRVIPVRPQLFSLVLFAVLLGLLAAADRGRRRALMALPLVMAAWTNLHGGWLVGLSVLGLWTAMTLLERAGPTSRRNLILISALAAVATLVNPYGAGMWRFLYDTVGFGRADISDWQPIYRLSPVEVGTWALVATVGSLIVWRSVKPTGATVPLKYCAIAALLGIAAFRVSRLDAFFTIAVVMLLAPFAASPTRAASTPAPAARPASRRLAVATIAAAGIAIVPLSVAFAQRAGCVAMDRAYLPEAGAARFIQRSGLQGRMITWFDWGEYAIWHLSPAIRVSIDGRRETVYSDATVAANHRFFFQEDGARLRYADATDADYVWTPNALPVVAALERSGWVRIFRGPASSVFARPGLAAAPRPHTAAPAGGCFPGP